MKCPNCGFDSAANTIDCIKCGIVFSKVKQRAKAGSPKVLLNSKVLSDEMRSWERALHPLAKVKNYIQLIYDQILSLMWDELMKGENRLDQTANLIVFLIFCVFSFFFYHLGDFNDLIIFALVFIWFLDYLLARYNYAHNKQYDRILLHRTGKENFKWRQKSHDNKRDFDANFEASKIRHISIVQHQHFGGIFQEPIGFVWRISIALQDGTTLLLFEEKEIVQAVKKSKKVAKYFKVRLEFPESEMSPYYRSGGSVYDSASLYREIKSQDVLDVEEKENMYTISTNWSLASIWYYFLTVLKKSGFLLFVLIVTAVMYRFGMLINHYIGPKLGLHVPPLHFHLSFKGVLSIFVPDFEWIDGIEFAFAIGIMIYSGLKLMQHRSFNIDREKIQVQQGRNKVIDLDFSKIAPPVTLKHRRPWYCLWTTIQPLRLLI
jgi:hypothetical protein